MILQNISMIGCDCNIRPGNVMFMIIAATCGMMRTIYIINIRPRRRFGGERTILKTVIVMIAMILIAAASGGRAADAVPAAEKKPRTVVIKYEPEKEKIYKTIPLGVIDFETVNQVCRPWLSPGGLLINEESRGSILVYDSPGVISRISEFLRQADRSAVNVMVTFDYQETGGGNNFAITAKPVGSKDKYQLRPPVIRNERDSRMSSQFIVTRSGLPASIWVGQTMVDPSWLEFARRNPQRTIVAQNGKVIADVRSIPGEPKWTDVGASLMVRPFYREGGMIDLEIFPEVRYLVGKGRHQTVKVAELVTRITVREGQKVLVGGLIDSKRQQYLNIFGPDFFKRQDIGRISNMYISAKRAPDNTRYFNQDSPAGGKSTLPASNNGLPSMFRR